MWCSSNFVFGSSFIFATRAARPKHSGRSEARLPRCARAAPAGLAGAGRGGALRSLKHTPKASVADCGRFASSAEPPGGANGFPDSEPFAQSGELYCCSLRGGGPRVKRASWQRTATRTCRRRSWRSQASWGEGRGAQQHSMEQRVRLGGVRDCPAPAADRPRCRKELGLDRHGGGGGEGGDAEHLLWPLVHWALHS